MNIKLNQLKLTDGNTLKLASWNDFVVFLMNNHELKDCIYRGQRDPIWHLSPTLFRSMPEKYDWRDLQTVANHHLANFKKFTRGRHTISYTDPNDDDESWWALGQHYGLKTPLLDWVRSPYVAAYFSFIKKETEEEKKEKDKRDEQSRAIFIFDIEKIKQILTGIRGCKLGDALEILDPLTHENKRLLSQQGIFTYSKDFKYRDVESYLREVQEKHGDKVAEEIFLLKITIPDQERQNILKQLDLMNINESTLFPDLGGSSEYSNYLLEGMAEEWVNASKASQAEVLFRKL